MKRSGSAIWNGNLKSGHGKVSTESNALSNLPYSFQMRFEGEKGTNPEELIGAAHASCFSMALSAQLEKEGFTAKEIKTTATVTLEKTDEGFSIPFVHLNVSAQVPNAGQEDFEKAANTAKKGCPISKLLNATITMDAKLES